MSATTRTATGFLLVPLMLLTGCTVYRPQTEPEPRVQLRDSFLEPGVVSSDKWWEELHDPELSRLIDSALEENLSLLSAWSRLEQMHAITRAAGAQRFPTVDLLATGERVELQGNEGGKVDTAFAGLSLGYQVDLWKKINNRHRASLFDEQSSRQDVEATALALTGAAGELWYGIAADQATLELLDAQLDVGQDLLDLVQLRFANGLSSAVEVFQQRLQVETTRNQIPSTKTRLATRKHQVALMLGREPRASIPLPGRGLPELPPLPSTGMPLEILRSRPDVRAAELRLLAADHRLAAAIADRYPSLSITAGVGGQASSFGSILDSWFWNLAGSLFAPVFDGQRRAAEADRSRAVVSELFYAWETALLTACSDVEDALVTEQGLTQSRSILDTQLELARASLDRSRALYANGLTDYLTVLTSLQALQELERQAISTQQGLLSNRIRLHLALGGSWSQHLESPIHETEIKS